ncbi:PQQ-binding-like beta-propeller repeat protein [bacterium]|nr:PQQ-binding-like beta-propeller repeat protein [bacterium]
MNTMLATLILISAMCLASTGCGSGSQATAVPGEGAWPHTGGISPELSAQLKAELDSLLSAGSSGDRIGSGTDGPVGGQLELDYRAGELGWYFCFSGDFDQNGIVNSADLVQLGLHFGDTGPWPRDDIRSLIDADGNAVLDLADVVSVARNYGRSFTGYAVCTEEVGTALPADGPDGGAGIVLARLDLADGSGSGRRRFSYPCKRSPGYGIWVRALDDASQSESRRIVSSVWSMPGGNPARSGTSPLQGPLENELLWSVQLGEPVSGSPVLDQDGYIYVGTADGNLHVLDRAGERLWTTDYSYSLTPAAYVTAEGSMIASRHVDAYGIPGLAAYSAEGALLWTSYDYGSIGGVVEAGNGNLYITRNRGEISCLDSQGMLLWEYDTGDRLRHAPSLGADGTVYAGNRADVNSLLAVNPDGTLLWKHDSGLPISTGIAIAPEGQLYFGCSIDKGLHSVNPDGSGRWVYYMNNDIISNPAVAGDGTVLISGGDGYLHAISPELELRWKFQNRADWACTPLVDGRGNIYVGGDAAYCLSPDGKLLWAFAPENGLQFGSAAIDEEGTVYFGCSNGLLYAFGSNQRAVVAEDGAAGSSILVSWDSHPLAEQYRMQYRDVTRGDEPGWLELGTAGPLQTAFSHGDDSEVPCLTNRMYEYRVLPVSGGKPLTVWSKADRGHRNATWQPALRSQMVDMNPQHTQLTPLSGPDSNRLQWSLELPTGNLSSPSIGQDGTLYLRSLGNRFDSPAWLYAVSASGALKWTYELQHEIHGVPAVGPDGTIYISEHYRDLHALRPDGSLKWKFPAWGSAGASPVVSDDGTVYIVNDFGLHSVSTAGQANWHYAADAGGDALLGYDGNVYLSTAEGLACISRQGELQWLCELPDVPSWINPLMLPDGSLAVVRGMREMTICGVDSAGTLRWQVSIDRDLEGSLALTASQDLVYTTGVIRMRSSTGALSRFNGLEHNSGLNSPLVCADGRMYVGSDNDYVLALDADGQSLWSYATNGPVRTAPAMDSRGWLYVTGGGYLYAFGD